MKTPRTTAELLREECAKYIRLADATKQCVEAAYKKAVIGERRAEVRIDLDTEEWEDLCERLRSPEHELSASVHKDYIEVTW